MTKSAAAMRIGVLFRDDWKADEWLQKSLASSMTIRYPAPGMAFVFFLLSHPDQTEPYTIEKETKDGEIVVRLEVIAKEKASARITTLLMPSEAIVNDGSVPESDLSNNRFTVEAPK